MCGSVVCAAFEKAYGAINSLCKYDVSRPLSIASSQKLLPPYFDMLIVTYLTGSMITVRALKFRIGND